MKKRIFSIIMILMLVCSTICGCGNSSQVSQKQDSEPVQIDDFLDYVSLVVGSCDYVTGMFQILYSDNQYTYPESWAFLISGEEPIYKATNAGGNGAQCLTDAFIGKDYTRLTSSDVNTLAEYISAFRTAYATLETAQNDYKTTLKNLKNSDIDEELMNALEDLYIPLASYIELSLEPSGSIIEYSSNISKYSDEISEILKKIELYMP